MVIPAQFLLSSQASAPRTLCDVLDDTARSYPDSPAIDDGDLTLTYSELLALVRRGAENLGDAGVGRGGRVGIRMPSGSRDLYVAILSTLYAGAAYVPVDADDPAERAELVFGEAGVDAIIDAEGVHPTEGRTPVPAQRPTVDDDAWIIFTSGSTGTPKGVAVTHRNAAAFVDAYRRYAQPSAGPLGVQVAPFQVLASGSQTFETRDHLWHLDIADRLVSADADLFRPTRRLVVDTGDETATGQGVGWWEELTANGGEGMVVKPLANLTRGRRGLVQPGVKVRGREYLRIIYGPEYTAPEHLERLRARSLKRKRSLAMREYALGLEALYRFVEGEPLYRVHECVFGVLALESEPVDPRL